MEDNGKAAGFGPGHPDPGFAKGPKLDAALPDDVEIDYVDFSQRDGDVSRSFQIAWGNVSLFWMLHVKSAWDAISNKQAGPPTTEDMVTLLNIALDAIYRGDNTSRAQAIAHVRAEWPKQERSEYGSLHLPLPVSGPWDVEAIFPEGGRFELADPGKGPFRPFYNFYGKEWTLGAKGTMWDYHWARSDESNPALLAVTPKDTLEFKWAGCHEKSEVMELVRETFGDYPWTFEDFQFGTDCIG